MFSWTAYSTKAPGVPIAGGSVVAAGTFSEDVPAEENASEDDCSSGDSPSLIPSAMRRSSSITPVTAMPCALWRSETGLFRPLARNAVGVPQSQPAWFRAALKAALSVYSASAAVDVGIASTSKKQIGFFMPSYLDEGRSGESDRNQSKQRLIR